MYINHNSSMDKNSHGQWSVGCGCDYLSMLRFKLKINCSPCRSHDHNCSPCMPPFHIQPLWIEITIRRQSVFYLKWHGNLQELLKNRKGVCGIVYEIYAHFFHLRSCILYLMVQKQHLIHLPLDKRPPCLRQCFRCIFVNKRFVFSLKISLRFVWK